MYTMDKDLQPKRPVVTSLAGALTEARRWLEENQFDQVKDGDGLPWSLKLQVSQVPEPKNPKGVLWELKLHLSALVMAPLLIETGTLDALKDSRLLEMIGNESIELKMRPLVYRAPHEDAAKTLLADILPKLKASFAKSSLSEVKRALVGRYVDDRCRFGGGTI